MEFIFLRLNGMLRKLLKKYKSVQSQQDQMTSIKELIKQYPNEPGHLFDMACLYSDMGRFTESLALFKSAQFLADDGGKYEIKIIQVLDRLGAFENIRKRLKLDFIDEEGRRNLMERIKGKKDSWYFEAQGYGKYQRLRIISDKIREYSESTSVLDVGGGDGILSAVLEENPYFIVEPSLNGLDGTNIPFEDSFFDLTVSCDVMEHIKKDLRFRYLDELCRVTKRKVLITAPLGQGNRKMEEILFALTENPFTKEHLAHEYSTRTEIGNYLKDKGFDFKFSPVNFEPLYLAMSVLNNKFLDDKPELFEKLNRFVNKEYARISSIEPSYTYLLEINM